MSAYRAPTLITTLMTPSRTVLSLVLAGIFIAIPAGGALAQSAPSISVNAPARIPGAAVVVSGSGFGADETVRLNFGTQSLDVTADESGNFSGASMNMPSVPQGLQFVSGFGTGTGRWTLAYVWVAGFMPLVAPSSWFLPPGTALTFTGSGFGIEEEVQASYGGNPLGTFTTDAIGTFSGLALPLPLPLHNTTATIFFEGQNSHATTSVTVTIGQFNPVITPSAWYTAPGSTISLTGIGFAGGEEVVVVSNATTATTTANASGSFSLPSITLPGGNGGSASITATGAGSGASATASISLSSLFPWLTFSSYWAQGGSPLTIFGKGFAANESVSLFVQGGGGFATTTTDGTGAFSHVGSVPYGPSGSLTIGGTGVSSGALGMGSLTLAPVYTNPQLGSYAISPGSAVTFIGSGYVTNDLIEIRTDRTGDAVVHSFSADGSGSFSDSGYLIPMDFDYGNLTLTVRGTHSFDEKTITLWVQAP